MVKNQPVRKNFGNSILVRVIQTLSRAITLIFLLTLIWSIYQAVINRNPLPAWTWLGMLVLFAAAVGLGVMVLVYRGVTKETGPFDFRPWQSSQANFKNEAKRVEAGGATSLRAEIRMTAGVLQVMSAAFDVMDADFTYDDADWKPPMVEYFVDAAGRAELSVEQKATGRPAMHPGRCEWILRLNSDLPTELDVKFGAGKADLQLGGLTLSELRVESGMGEVHLDLGADPGRDLDVFFKSGIGDASIVLPKNTGVRVRSSVGLGSIKHNGLHWDGEFYTNRLYGQTTTTLEMTIEGGMGKITFM